MLVSLLSSAMTLFLDNVIKDISNSDSAAFQFLIISPFLGSFTSPHCLDFSLNVTKHVFFQFLLSNSHPYQNSGSWNNSATLLSLSLLLSLLTTSHFPATVFAFLTYVNSPFPMLFLHHSSLMIVALYCNSVESFFPLWDSFFSTLCLSTHIDLCSFTTKLFSLL